MKRLWYVRLAMVAAAALLLATSAYAEVTTSGGVTFRLRQETWDNLFDFREFDAAGVSNDDNFWRLKTSPWLKLDMDKKHGAYVKLTNEARYVMDTSRVSSRPLGFQEDELVFDNLYVYENGVLGLPVDLTVGRQDFLMTFGEGFLIMDGTPGDGSRTYYFNAARAATKFNDQWGLDLVYLFTQTTDRALPSLYSHSVKRSLNTSDERGFVAYGRGKVSDSFTIEPYYMYKNEEAAALPAFDSTELDLHTVGARAVLGFGGGWKLKGEFAHQFGDYDSGNDRVGDGGYLTVGRAYDQVALKPAFELGYYYLSGDDPDTNKVEGWDPLFSRWPWMSELYVLSYGSETGIPGYWTNLQLARANFKFALNEQTGLELTYGYLLANEDPGLSTPAPIFSNDGKKRGDLIQAKLNHNFSKTVSGYLLIEDFIPGDYYLPANQDNATFVRWELQWKI